VLQEVSAHAGLSVSQASCRCFDEYLRSLDEVVPERLHALRAAVNDLDSLEFGAPRAMLVGQYSVALGRSGRRQDGIAAIMRVLAQCDEAGDHWYTGELRRIHGELLLMGQAGDATSTGDARDGEACLSAALEESLIQGCRSLQLRAATSLGRCWHAQGRSAEAVELLKSACSKLTEGLDWDDFKAATRLLKIAAAAGKPADVCDDAFAGRNAAATAFDDPSAENIWQCG
jgi:hypothetical protein